jgi:hypothetical protein
MLPDLRQEERERAHAVARPFAVWCLVSGGWLDRRTTPPPPPTTTTTTPTTRRQRAGFPPSLGDLTLI